MVEIEVPQEKKETRKRNVLPVMGHLFMVIMVLIACALGALAYWEHVLLKEKLDAASQGANKNVSNLNSSINKNAYDIETLTRQDEESRNKYQELNAELRQLKRDLLNEMQAVKKDVANKYGELQAANNALRQKNKRMSSTLDSMKKQLK